MIGRKDLCYGLWKAVTDLINKIVQVLRRELVQFWDSVQEAGLIKPVELWDEG